MKILVVDVETTGFSADKDDILEVACVTYEDGEQRAEFAHLLTPRKRSTWSDEVIQVHKITPQMVAAEGRPPIDVMRKFLKWVELSDALVAYNSSFEDRMLRRLVSDLGLTWVERPWIDPMKLVNRFIKKAELKERNLKAVCRHFGITLSNAHEALPDTRATGSLLYQIAERYKVNLSEEVAGVGKQLGGLEPGDGPMEALYGGYRDANANNRRS